MDQQCKKLVSEMQQNGLVGICKLYSVIWDRLRKIQMNKNVQAKEESEKTITFKRKSCIYEV